jgi:NAD(P)H-quinone oxidoreductase subunit 5
MTGHVAVLIALSPLSLLAMALVPSEWANRHPTSTARTGEVLIWTGVGISLVGAYAYLREGLFSSQFLSLPLDGANWLSLSVYFDSLTAVMLMLVSFIGAVVTRFSRNYLDGDPGQGRFHKWLSVTLGSVLALIVSGNLLMLTIAWMMTSLSLHRLLTFYPDRLGGVVAARKKFVISRLGDACLIAAVVVVYQAFDTLEFGPLFAAADALDMSDSAQGARHTQALAPMISVLLVFAALLKSAQFPFHSWLPEVMETPTPVSALMHAGIINAGGFLLVRMSHIVVLSPTTLSFLAMVGAITALYGSLVMLTQTSVKKALAFSTVGQMGFMMLQCGLGAFSAAVLHIVAHALYKAHAFLSCGSVVDLARASWVQTPRHTPQVGPMLGWFVFALAMTLVVGTVFGVSPETEPGTTVLGGTVVLAVTYLLWNSSGANRGWAERARLAGLALLVCLAYFTVQAIFAHTLAGALPSRTPPAGRLELAVTYGVILLFAGALLIQAGMPGRAGSGLWQRLYVHLYNGLYISAIANRLIERIWPLPHTPRQPTA